MNILGEKGKGHLCSRFIHRKGKAQMVPIEVHTLKRWPKRGYNVRVDSLS